MERYEMSIFVDANNVPFVMAEISDKGYWVHEWEVKNTDTEVTRFKFIVMFDRFNEMFVKAVADKDGFFVPYIELIHKQIS